MASTTSLMDKMIDKAAEDFAKAIDKQIMDDLEKEMLMDEGWVSAPFTTKKFTWPFKHVLDEVVAWIHINHTDEYKIVGNEFCFKNPTDLTAFILRWS